MSLFHKLKSIFIQEMVEFLPWALMAYIAGILTYFFVDKTVNCYTLMALILCAGSIWFYGRRKLFLSWFSVVFFFFFLGLENIALHSRLNHCFVPSQSFYHEWITAVVYKNQPLIEKQIVTLDKIYWKNPDLKLPKRIRVYFSQVSPLLKQGDEVKVLVNINPPKDSFKQFLCLQKIDAIGVADEIHVLKSSSDKWFSFVRIRHAINQHLFQILPYSQAEIAAPLITGEKALISKDTYKIYRRSGIAHILSVSGFHMALLATFLFFCIRKICAFFPRIALYYNTKKISALIGLVGTFLYLALSGFQISAIRAFIMIAFVFLGIFIDKSVLSMRTLMLTAFGILLFFPQMILSVSFQLSFIATAVLVKVCQFVQNQSWGKWGKFWGGFILLNIFVSSALFPFVIYHFHQFTPYGVGGNILFNGIFSFFIMPLLFLGTIMMSFGVDKIFFYIAGFGLDIVHLCAEKISELPYSENTTSFISLGSLIFISFGILLLCFMKTSFKYLGYILILIGMIWGVFS